MSSTLTPRHMLVFVSSSFTLQEGNSRSLEKERHVPVLAVEAGRSSETSSPAGVQAQKVRLNQSHFASANTSAFTSHNTSSPPPTRLQNSRRNDLIKHNTCHPHTRITKPTI